MDIDQVTALRERLVASRRNQVKWLAGRPVDEALSPGALSMLCDAHVALQAIDAVLAEDSDDG